jgi:cation transport ATPase
MPAVACLGCWGMASGQASSAAAGVAPGRRTLGLVRHAFGWVVEHRARILAAIAALSIVVGGVLYLAGERAAGRDVWGAAVALLAAELAVEVVRTVIVDHHMGVDTIALVAMVGALALGEEFAGVIVGLMFSGGATLEDLASTRARRELTALIQRAPKVAQLRVGEQLEQVPVAQVKTGDVVVVRTGEVVPVDGTIERVAELRGRGTGSSTWSSPSR